MTVELADACIPDGHRVYAIGDVHGCLVELNALLATIDQERRANPELEHKIVFLGDYVDRGPDSKRVVTRLMCLQNRDPDVTCLRGNHDMALSRFIEDPKHVADWYFRNGGAATLESYGMRAPELNKDRIRVKDLALQLASWFHRTWMTTRPLSLTIGDYMFCHAGIRPGVALDQQSDQDLMWIRDEFHECSKPYDKVIVHGHTARGNVDVRSNRINIDTSCVHTGVLTALVLEGKDWRLLQTSPKATSKII